MIAAQNAYTQQHHKVQHKSEDEEDNFSGRWLCLELQKGTNYAPMSVMMPLDFVTFPIHLPESV
jgi:hypothetical protein